MQELQVEFDKLDLNGVDKPRQTRFLRSQQDLKQKMIDNDGSQPAPSSMLAEDMNGESKRPKTRSNISMSTRSARRHGPFRSDRTREHSRLSRQGFLRPSCTSRFFRCLPSPYSLSLSPIAQDSKQWKDRKEVLDDLLNILTRSPRPSPTSDYSDLIKVLRKVKHGRAHVRVYTDAFVSL